MSPTPHTPPNTPRNTEPKFGRLLAVCALAVLLCGVLVWLMSGAFADCCDLSWLGRIIR